MQTTPRGARAALAIAFFLCITSAAAAANLDVEFDPANFSNPTQIDNMYWPLTPGTTSVYLAETEDGCEVDQVTVTANIKSDFAAPYDGIQAVEVTDLAWASEECGGDYTLIEKTSDWFGQDDDGNVWYFGEDTQSYDDESDCLTDEGSWQAGDGGAQAGIVMLADPAPGLAYSQEYLEDEAEDMAKVLRLNAYVELDGFGPFTDCLVTKEWTPLERGEIEHKTYCPQLPGLATVDELKARTVHVEYVGSELPEGTFPTDLPDVGECPSD